MTRWWQWRRHNSDDNDIATVPAGYRTGNDSDKNNDDTDQEHRYGNTREYEKDDDDNDYNYDDDDGNGEKWEEDDEFMSRKIFQARFFF